MDPPLIHSDYSNRVTIMGEIISAENFDEEDLYIMYSVFLPDGWTFEDQNEYEIMGISKEDTSEFNKR